MLYALQVVVADISKQADHPGGENLRALALCQQLGALRCGIGALVILAGQILHCKAFAAVHFGNCLIINSIGVRLGEDDFFSLGKLVLAQAGNIVPIKQTQFCDVAQSEVLLQVGQHLLRFNVEAGSFFHKNAGHLIRHVR